MVFFLSVCLIILALLIFFQTGIKRLIFFICGITFIPFGIEVAPHLDAHRILILSFYLSICIHKKEFKELKTIPGFRFIIIILITHLLTGFFDSRLSLFAGTYKSIIAFLETFGTIFFGYVSCHHRDDKKYITRFIRIFSLILALYSLFTFFVGYDFFNQTIPGTDSLTDSRHRISSFLSNSHLAGLAFSMYLLIILYDNYIKNKNSLKSILVYLLFIALLLTMSRSSLLNFITGCLFLYIPILLKSPHKKILITSFILIIIVCNQLIYHILLQKFGAIFEPTGSSDVSGSNLETRTVQLYYSWLLFLNHPWLGNGFQYFWEVIKADGGSLSDYLAGAESYIFILLIERGLIQIIAISAYFIFLFSYFRKHKNAEISTLAIAMLVAFLVNSILTGNGYKWTFCFPFLGMYIKSINFKYGNQ